MITGAHIILYSEDAEKDRAFFRDVLQFGSVDAGEGWLIFALPPAELGVHPTGDGCNAVQAELYLMCDDLAAVVRRLGEKGIRCTEVSEAPWGRRTSVRLPGGSEIGLYQPAHPTAISRATPPG